MLRGQIARGIAEGQLPSGNMPAAQAAAFGGRSAPVALPCPASAATVNVREADDVVFAGVWPRLYFDQHKRDDSRILETMDVIHPSEIPV